jgi:hypothetical protein
MSPTIFLFGVLFCLAGWFVFSPLFRDSQTDLNMILDNTIDSQKALQQKRSELMLTLKELDFDFEMGKLSKEDYVGLKKKFEAETIDILRQIDFEKSSWDKFQKQIDEKLGTLRA